MKLTSIFLRRFIQWFSLYLHLLLYVVKKIASQIFIFQNLNFFRFYLRHVRKAYRVFSRDTFKKFQLKNMRFCQNIFWPGFDLHVLCFELKLFSIVSRKVYVKGIRCVKDVSFETDFKSMRRIFQLQVAFCGQIALSFMNTSKMSGRSA